MNGLYKSKFVLVFIVECFNIMRGEIDILFCCGCIGLLNCYKKWRLLFILIMK